MSARTLWRDSVIVFGMVVISAYGAALVLNLVFNPPENQTGIAALAAGLFLLVVALGLVLRRNTEDSSET